MIEIAIKSSSPSRRGRWGSMPLSTADHFISRLESLRPLLRGTPIRAWEIAEVCGDLRLCIASGEYDGDVLRHADDVFCAEKPYPSHEYLPEVEPGAITMLRVVS